MYKSARTFSVKILRNSVAEFDHVARVPNADFEEKRCAPMQGLGDARPAKKQALLGGKLPHDALKLAQHTDINGRVLRLDLDHEPGRIEAERALSATISMPPSAPGGDHNAIALGFE